MIKNKELWQSAGYVFASVAYLFFSGLAFYIYYTDHVIHDIVDDFTHLRMLKLISESYSGYSLAAKPIAEPLLIIINLFKEAFGDLFTLGFWKPSLILIGILLVICIMAGLGKIIDTYNIKNGSTKYKNRGEEK